MLKLKSLTFEALRGATQPFELKFESGKKIAIVFGENGSGKSTICDALDLLGNDGLGSLEGKGLSSTTKYWHSTTRKPTDIKITLTSTADSWSAQVIKGKCVVEPADTRPKVKILRRHQILNLLAGRPADRYQALQPFLAIESLDDSERSLRDLINSTKRRLAEAGARIGENVETLENVWKQAGSPGVDMMKWAEAEAQREVTDLNNTISAIQEYQRRTPAFASRMADLSAQTDVDSAARVALAKAEIDLSAALANAEDGSEELIQLLQAARHYFERHENPETCPLCQSREFAATLSETVESKLKAMGTVRRALESRNAAQRALETAASRLESATASARISADQLRELCEKWPKDLPPATDVLKVRAGKSGWSQEELKRLIDSATNLHATLQPELTSRTQMKTLLQTVRDALDQYKHNIQQKAELDSLLPRLDKTHEVLVSERRAFVDDVLTKIATRVGELYEEIHPGEGLSKISLQLDPVKRASLDVVSEFPGATAPPPAAYLSESHLDTLGISIFLALAELENPSDTVLVLDDVVASVDEPHVDRIINMLYDVSQNFAHCVLTTHYQPWREKFRWGKLQKGECQLVELGQWTLLAGLVTSKTTPRVEVLRSHVQKSPPEPADICSSAGVFLEHILNFLADQYECSVPRRRGKPALRDLIQSINKKLRGALRVELHDGALAAGTVAPVVHLGPVLDKLEKFANVRNVIGCHFDEISFHLNPADAVEFGTMVLQLAEALLHPDHGWLQTLEQINAGGATKGVPIVNFYDMAAEFGNCRLEGGVEFRHGKKPERLLWTILKHFSEPGDWVLDSFAGSGTTGAVAQKMLRRWIMVELRDHCYTLIVPRLKRVIDGTDTTGITENLSWKGGGGFRYYRVAPSLLEKDKWGNWVINKQYNAAMLAEALCKLEGFTYAPSDTIYWRHGHSTERDFMYVTTAHLTHDQLQQLSDEVGLDRTLLVLCTAFRARADQFPNLTVKKIPKAVLSRCEYGHDDYSLQVENLPQAPPERGQQALFEEESQAGQS